MSIFSIIAEAKIQDWFRRKNAGELKQPDPDLTIDKAKCAESYLLEDILRLIKQANEEHSEARDILLQKAKEMEIQLLTTLEKDGFYLMAQMNAETIREHKNLYKQKDTGELSPETDKG